jgi:cell division protein FtsL
VHDDPNHSSLSSYHRHDYSHDHHSSLWPAVCLELNLLVVIIIVIIIVIITRHHHRH